MKNCFLCTTPYQILAVLSLLKGFKKTGDLYIINQFTGAETLAERIRKEALFDNVIFIDEELLYSRYVRTGPRLKRWLGLTRIYEDTDLIVKNFIKDENEYEDVFISSNNLTARLAVLYLYKYYGLSTYSLFDDGIGSYRNKYLGKIGPLGRIYREIFIQKGSGKIKISDRYLYRDDLYLKMNPRNDKEKIHKLNFLSQDNYALIYRLFGLNHTIKINEKVIILDSYRAEELTEKGVAQIAELFDLISTTLNPDQIIFKAHPRDKTPRGDFHYLASSGDINLPFEVYASLQDFSDKILITNMSTAVFSPKMVLDQEPTLIFLFKILEHEIRNHANIDDLVRNFKDLYRDPTKIYVPESKEELEDILRDLKLRRDLVPV